MVKCTCCAEIKASLAHIKLAHELRKDAKEGLCVGCFAIFSKVRGGFAEFLQRSLLQGLQRLNCRMSVFQEVLHIPGSRDTSASSSLIYNCSSIRFVWHFFGKDTLMTTAKRSSAVAGIFWQAARMSWMVVWRSFRSDVIVLWFTERRKIDQKGETLKWAMDRKKYDNIKIKWEKSVYFWLQGEPWLNL